MSKYFQEVEFEIGQDPGEPPPPPPTPTYNPDKVKVAGQKIREEFEKIRMGVSDLCTYAFDPGRFANPVGENLRRFELAPSEQTMAGFLQVVKQDIGLRAAVRFMEMIEEAKEKTNE